MALIINPGFIDRFFHCYSSVTHCCGCTICWYELNLSMSWGFINNIHAFLFTGRTFTWIIYQLLFAWLTRLHQSSAPELTSCTYHPKKSAHPLNSWRTAGRVFYLYLPYRSSMSSAVLEQLNFLLVGMPRILSRPSPCILFNKEGHKSRR